MRKIVITCDRCGKTIEGNPMKLSAEYTSRDDDAPVTHSMPDAIKHGLIDDCTRDYCERCIQEILEFAHINMAPQQYVEDKKTELVAKEEQKKPLTHILKRGQREMVEQFFARGMSEERIAKNMGLDLTTVHRVVDQIQKAG